MSNWYNRRNGSCLVPRFAVVGWSDGGISGLLTAISYPAAVTHLVAAAANYQITPEFAAGEHCMD